MPQFFVSQEVISGNRCVITGKDHHHLVRVLRVHPGEIIDLRTDKGIRLTARVEEITEKSLIAEIIDKKTDETISLNISLYVSLLKGRKFETVIQKAVELGVDKIIPVSSARSVPHLEGKEQNRLERWKKIAAEAAKQCMRSEMPRIESPVSFKDAASTEASGLKIIAHPDAGGSMPRLCRHRDIPDIHREQACLHLLVGPEGGFTDSELALADDNGWKRFNFGFTQLRAETAAIVLPAILIYEWSRIHEDNG